MGNGCTEHIEDVHDDKWEGRESGHDPTINTPHVIV